MEKNHSLYKLLTHAGVYQFFQNFISRSPYSFIDDLKSSGKSLRALDVGCGTGFIRGLLPDDWSYIGLDYSEEYILDAQSKDMINSTFHKVDLTKISPEELLLICQEKFDWIILSGILHHIETESAIRLIKILKPLLKESGKIISYDPTFVSGQGVISKFLVSLDRGKFVRSPEDYSKIFSKAGFSADFVVVDDAMKIPYHHCKCTVKVPHSSSS